jgi:glycosyltransferase involved in cell wall biosynthesis
MKISIIIPAYNEEEIIEKTIKKTYGILNKKKYDFEIIVVNDNSDDKTEKIIDRLSKTNKKIKPIHKKSNTRGPTGMGSALKFGFKHCRGDIIIPLMADLSDDPNEIIQLVKKIFDGFDVVCGSRFIKGSKIIGYPRTKMIFNRIYNRLFAFLFSLEVKDISNAFKAYRKSVIDLIKPKSNNFAITAEILLKAKMFGFKIAEVPVSWHGRTKGESKFGSFSPVFIVTKVPKIGYQYGVLALTLWFKFLHKKLKKILNVD